MEEEWRELKEWKGVDFSGCFLVSNMGDVKTIDRWVPCSSGKKQHRKSIYLKKCMDKGGYLHVSICKNRIHKTPPVHILVMNLFNPNPNPEIYTDINHIDEDKTNNRLDNLEWTTHKGNINHGTGIERRAETVKNKFMPIIQLDLSGNIVDVYKLREDISVKNQNFHTDHIIRRINKNRNICYGYFWIRETDYNKLSKENLIILINSQTEYNAKMKSQRTDSEKVKIVQLSKNGELLNIWDSERSAAISLDVSPSAIVRAVSGKTRICCGYFWMQYSVYKNMTQKEIENFVKYRPYEEKCIKIVQLDRNNGFIRVWDSITEAKNALNISGTTNICACLKKKNNTCKGFKWMYLDEYNEAIEKVNNDGKAITQKEGTETENKKA